MFCLFPTFITNQTGPLTPSVDLGSGVGNCVVQAALEAGCRRCANICDVSLRADAIVTVLSSSPSLPTAPGCNCARRKDGGPCGDSGATSMCKSTRGTFGSTRRSQNASARRTWW